MQSKPGILLITLLAGIAPLHAVTSTLELKSGSMVRGEVLADRPERVVVDLGFSVLSVPRDEIDRVVEDSAEPTVQNKDSGDLFHSQTGAAILPVKENVERVGDAVVLVRTPTGLGSGFVINPAGYIITNEHVVSGEYNITVTRFVRTKQDMERVTYNNVRIVAMDAQLDLALLKIEDENLPALKSVPLGETSSVVEGQSVFAIGSPLGLDRTVSQGIVSSRNRLMDGQLYIQTTTQINPGNSGGPLFNLRGEVVGVNNMKAMQVGVEGLNFAIPVSVVKTFLRNRDAFAFDASNPNSGYRYLSPPGLVQDPGSSSTSTR